MIWITGDTHGDTARFQLPSIKKLGRQDTLIVCGDFGFIWDGSKKESRILKQIGKRRHYTLFVEGCRDNYDLLAAYPTVSFMGGKARQISGNLYQLLRGEIYEIEGKKFFTFGGGCSDESWMDISSPSAMWWPQEQPSDEEMEYGLQKLKEAGRVDVIITHDAPASIRRFIYMENNDESRIHTYLENILSSAQFDRWFFGHYHMDKKIPPRFEALFQSARELR